MKDARTLVAWDNYCELYVPLEELRGGCPAGQVNQMGQPHFLRKRRVFICPGCEDAFFDGNLFIGHIAEHIIEHESESS